MIDMISFTIAAFALLGSPGPAIAALLAVGKSDGWSGGLRFFSGLQLGLASAAALSAIGLFALVNSSDSVLTIMSVLATVYLVYLAFKIATSEVGDQGNPANAMSSVLAGVMLGLTNPKAYLAFASLFASFQLVERNLISDGLSKWMIVVLVMLIVDLIWLWIGVRLGRLRMSIRCERTMNLMLGAAVIFAASFAWV